MKRGCWIALWAIGAYVVTCIGLSLSIEVTHKLLAGVTIPAWFSHHIALMTRLAQGLLPYIAGSVVFCVGLGAHLPGTRMPRRGQHS